MPFYKIFDTSSIQYNTLFVLNLLYLLSRYRYSEKYHYKTVEQLSIKMIK